jgi:hypothetical protein
MVAMDALAEPVESRFFRGAPVRALLQDGVPMMNDLDTLRPEVREAWQRIVADEQHPEDFECVEAELLRLADECATLKAQSIYPRAQFLLNLADANERAEKAETELTIAHRERDRMFLDAREWATRFGEMEARAEKAEAELAESRETIKRLNRRVQIAEAGVAEKVKEHAGGSLGRALANAAADMYMRERDEAQAELAALKARILPGAAKVEIADTDDPDGNPYGWVGGTLLSHNLIGKRVRLVVEE